MAAGYDHCLFLDKNQRLITLGENDLGQTHPNQFVDAVHDPTFHPYFIQNQIKLKCIRAGNSFSLCIDIDGGCYLFGDQDEGKLGNGKIAHCQYIPFKINDKINDALVVDASLGEDHTVLLTNQNQVITFGDNTYHKCSSMVKAERILEPHIVSKTKEIGILETSFVENVLALNNTTLIFMNPNRAFHS